MSRAMTSVLMAIAIASPALAGQDCPESALRSHSIEANGVRQVFIEARAGSLEVEGTAGVTVIQAKGKACAPDVDLLEEILLVVERRGDKVHIVTEIPNRDWSFWKRSPSLDLAVELPRDVKLIVEDGSGATTIRGVKELRLRDGSGAITVSDVDGDVEIEDGAGALSVDDVGGSLELMDGSGGLTIEDVRGSVRIEDGSGSIRVSDIGGDLWIEDGSGSIQVESVTGNVVVHEDGSGGIEVRSVRGDFTVRRDGSGGIQYSKISGSVNVPERR